mgnify:CR=1 FL=1
METDETYGKEEHDSPPSGGALTVAMKQVPLLYPNGGLGNPA